MTEFKNESNDCYRVDVFLMTNVKVSRSKIASAIKSGFVTISGNICTKPSTIVSINDTVGLVDEFFEPKPKPISRYIPKIIYEDFDILIVDKPAGLVVHDGEGVRESTLVDYLRQEKYELAECCGSNRDGIVHRLDVGTSGVMVVAKNDTAAISLKESITNKETGKIYLALIDTPLKDDCIVDEPIGRDLKSRVKMKVQQNGKPSQTLFLKLLEAKNRKYELILAKIMTGRTHQIRAHLAHLGRHIVGDSLYGFKSQNVKLAQGRVMLHSYILDIKHPIKQSLLRFCAEIPNDYLKILDTEFQKENIDEVIDKTYIDSRISSFFSRMRHN